MPTAQRGQARIDIAAPPDVVYDLIADVTRMGEWSPECYRCEGGVLGGDALDSPIVGRVGGADPHGAGRAGPRATHRCGWTG